MSTNTKRVIWMSRRPYKGSPVEELDQLQLTVENGMIGDHYSGTSRKRQVSLMQEDFLMQVSQRMGLKVDMTMTRRNILIQGINLTDLIGKRFRIGTAVLEGTGPCKPCKQMDTTIGPGGWKAMEGLAGITACVLEDGEVKVGDELLLT